jgi:hypothetical protein
VTEEERLARRRAYQKAYRAKHKDKRYAQIQAWVKARPGYQKRGYEKRKARNPEAVAMQAKQNALKNRYGMSVGQFNDMVEYQAGLCAMCCEAMQPGRGTHVDHNHRTGIVRGLLCSRCNPQLGVIESPHVLIDALAYLAAFTDVSAA